MKTYDGKTISKKNIVAILRTYNVTDICALMNRVTGSVPTQDYIAFESQQHSKCLDGFSVYQWAKQFAASGKMERRLYHMLDRASHHWKLDAYSTHYPHVRHGWYEPLKKARIVDFLKEQCQDVTSNYVKRPMMGHTHLYFCSPVYGHSDYNKWCALPIEGNERFCELVIRYADKFFGPVYDK